MSEATHSPGPWQAIAADDGGFDIADSNGEWVAEEIDDEADALLIAAAPELLAAAMSLMENIGHLQPIHAFGGDASVKAMKAAIARAKGAP